MRKPTVDALRSGLSSPPTRTARSGARDGRPRVFREFLAFPHPYRDLQRLRSPMANVRLLCRISLS